MLKLTFTPSDRSPGDLTVLELSDEQITAGLQHDVGEKAGSAFLPCILEPAYRSNANVKAMTALCLDLDHLEEGALELLVETLKSKGVKHWWFHSFTYPNARLLIPFAKPLPLNTPEDWSKKAWPTLVAYLELDKVARADPACRDAARLFYEPRKPSATSPHRSGFMAGDALDWEVILAGDKLPKVDKVDKVDKIAIRPPVPGPRPKTEDPSRPVDIEAVRKKLLRKQPGSFAHKLAKGHPLSPPPGLRRTGEPARKLAWFYAMGSLSLAADAWMATAALLEICRPSWQAEVDESPEDYTPWEKVEALLVQQRASAETKKAEYAAKRESVKTEWQRILGTEHATHREPTDDEVDPAVPATEDALEGAALIAALEWSEPRDDATPELLRSAHNLSIILRESFYWKGMFRRNLLTGMVECWGGPCFEPGIPPFDVTDTHALFVRHWLVETFGAEFFKTAVDEYIDLAAADNAYDPVVDYLRALKWDGKGRLDDMLSTYFKAETTVENVPYVRAVGAKWMLGAVARALEPGCQMDTMLVLQGKQGIRKSSAVRVLGGKWSADFAYSIGSNESQAACSENWIMEVGELSSLSRADREKTKEFLTKRYDKFRAPYAKRQENHPRRCVLIGSSNEDELFSDETGNRRFWPVTCTEQIDTDALERDRDQLWAEAVVRYEAGEKWHLDQETSALAAREAKDRMKHDVIIDIIVEWYERQAPSARPSEVRVMDIVRSALDMDRQPDSREQHRIVSAMKRLGFKKLAKKRVEGVPTNVWAAPEKILTLPHRSAGTVTSNGVTGAPLAEA